MFCPKCGKESDGLCAECYLEGNRLKFEKTEISLCTICGKVYHRGAWTPGFEKAIKNLIRKNLIVPQEIEAKKIGFEIVDQNNKRIFLKILFSGKYKNETITTELNAEIKVINKTCEQCGRISGGYYEAVLQVRSDDLSDLENINKIIALDSDFITKIENVKNGIDIYLTSQQYANEIKNKFRDKGFVTKTSSKLMGKKEGRDFYRVYISVKPPRFKEGDFIKIDNRVFRVMEVGKNVISKDLETGVIKTVSGVKLQKSEILVNPKVRGAVVSSLSPGEIQVLDMKNYETIELKNEKNKFALKPGDEIKILRVGKRVYVL